MDTFLKDVRFGLRTLAGNLHFSLAAIFVLALGFAANGVIFSFVDAILLRPLPVSKPNELVRVFTSQKTKLGEEIYGPSSYADYLDLRKQSAALAGLVAIGHRGAIWTSPQGRTLLAIDNVSENYFAVLGVQSRLGRTFSEEEAPLKSAAPEVVLSYGMWKDRLGGDPGMIGKTIQLNDQLCTVVGVAPREFRGTDSLFAPDVWLLLGSLRNQASELNDRNSRLLELIGRLRRGEPISQAQAEASVVGAQLVQAYPKTNTGSKFTVEGEKESRSHGLSIFADMLLGISGLVLLIACVNVANLLLYRSETRRREFGIRRALGARPSRLIRQLLTENALLSLFGGAFSLLISYWIIRVLPSLVPPISVIPLGFDFRLDGRVLGFTVFLALFAVLVFGLAPTVRAAKGDLLTELTESRGAGKPGVKRGRVRQGLVVAQLSVSLMLLLGAGLLVRSLVSAEGIDPGFNHKQNMLLVGVLSFERLTPTQFRLGYDRILDQLEGLPGVRQASLTQFVPLSLDGGGLTKNIIVPGKEPPPGEEDGQAIHYTVVGPGYFSTMGIRIMQGRAFGREDGEASPGVVMINETLARRLWPGEDAVGRQLLVGGPKGRECEVIGVAQDGKYWHLTEREDSYMYMPFSQAGGGGELSLLVQTAGDPRNLADSIRQRVQGVDKNMMIFSVTTLSEHMRNAAFEDRTAMQLVSTLGLLGLLLAAVGLYGLVSYAVSGRTHEIGIRLALGAQRRDIVRMVLGQGVRLTLLGAGIGLALGIALMRVLNGYVFGAQGFDVPSFVLPTVLLAGVALAASYLPAHRATRVDPAVALRHD
ncbi:MAG: ABC transporter permease [Candidatus Acidiferrales bacterium]